MGLFSWLHHRFTVPRAYQHGIVQHGAILSLECPAPFLRASAVLTEACVLRKLPVLGPADVSMPGVCVQVLACRFAWNMHGVALAEEMRLVRSLLLSPPVDLLHGVLPCTETTGGESWIVLRWMDCNLMRQPFAESVSHASHQ